MFQRLARIWHKHPEVGVIFVSIILVVVFNSSTEGTWLSLFNIREVLRITAILAILALGEAFVVSTGQIDISVGSMFGIAGILYIGLTPEIGPLPAIAIAMIAAMLIGCMNGLIVAYLGIPSLVVTLGSLFLFRGIAIAASNAQAAFSFSITRDIRENPILRFFGGGDVLDYNNAIIWVIIAVIVVQYIFSLHPLGNKILAVGGDADSARSRGVRVRRVILGVFIVSGFFAGLAGILEGSKLGYVDGAFGNLIELQAIAVVVLGGTALLGGRTSVIGTLFGAFILSAIQSYLVIQGIQPQWFTLILGAIIVLVALFDRLMRDSLVRFAR
jgi:simple sugar transport system permease protein/ribose transport system permease protein